MPAACLRLGRGHGGSFSFRTLSVASAKLRTPLNFKGRVVGFYGEQSKALAGVASMIADAQTANLKWQARYGRDPTDQQRAWLVNKVLLVVRADIAMRATKLTGNAQVHWQLTNLQTMYSPAS